MTVSRIKTNLDSADSLSVPITNFSILKSEIDSRGRNYFAYSDVPICIFIVEILKREKKKN